MTTRDALGLAAFAAAATERMFGAPQGPPGFDL